MQEKLDLAQKTVGEVINPSDWTKDAIDVFARLQEGKLLDTPFGKIASKVIVAAIDYATRKGEILWNWNGVGSDVKNKLPRVDFIHGAQRKHVLMIANDLWHAKLMTPKTADDVIEARKELTDLILDAYSAYRAI